MSNMVKFQRGTAEQFRQAAKQKNVFYFVDEKDLYLGEIKLSNGADLAAAIERIATIENDYLKATQGQILADAIEDINEELAALTGTEEGKSINQMISTAIAELENALQAEINANAASIEAIENDYLKGADKTELSNAIAGEKSRAEGIEAGLRTDVNAIAADYLKAADKTELEGKITAEATTARAAEKANADAIAEIKADVDAFFKDADLTESAKDTLKEIQEYINSDAQGAAAMTESINGVKDRVKAIEDDYLVEADKTELTNAINGKVAQGDFNTLAAKVNTEGNVKEAIEASLATAKKYTDDEIYSNLTDFQNDFVNYVDGKVRDCFDSATDWADDEIKKLDAVVESAAVETGKGIKVKVTEVDGKLTAVEVTGNYDEKYDAKGTAATAESNAKAYAKEYADGLAGNYDAKGAAATAEANAKAHANAEIAKLSEVYEAKGEAAKAESAAKAYADSLAGNYDAAGMAAAAETNAKKHANDLVAALDADKKSAEVAEGQGVQVQVVEVDGKITEVNLTGNYDNRYDAKGAAAQALVDAKAYTNGLVDNCATADQGAKADSALQIDDLSSGSKNGTFSIYDKEYDNWMDVEIAGLKSAAYQDASTFEEAGKAEEAKQAANNYTNQEVGTLRNEVEAALTWGEIELNLN